MSPSVSILIALLLAWILYMGYLSYAGGRIKGKEIGDLASRLPELAKHQDRALIYCYSPRCGPCQSMTPIIDSLREAGEPIIKLDLPQHLEVAEELGVRATPTLLLIRDGRIAEVSIGARNQHQVMQLLQTA